jgi:hypothetical protein
VVISSSSSSSNRVTLLFTMMVHLTITQERSRLRAEGCSRYFFRCNQPHQQHSLSISSCHHVYFVVICFMNYLYFTIRKLTKELYEKVVT